MKHSKLPHPVAGWQRVGLRTGFVVSMILIVRYMITKVGFSTILAWSGEVGQAMVRPFYQVNNGSGEIIEEPQIGTGGIGIVAQTMRPVVTQTISMSDLHHQIRMLLVKQLIDQGFTGRTSHLRTGDTNAAVTSTSTGSYVINRPIIGEDILDNYLDQLLEPYASMPLDPQLRGDIDVDSLIIPESEWRQWSGLYLFKKSGDLEQLGYEILSHRIRTNRDQDYRRFNIMTAFAKLGNVLILNSGQQLDYLRDIDYDESEKQNYHYGLSIIGDDEIKDYGGGICGSSTALYQGILTNTALDITQQRNHTRWYSDLYPAVINGQDITTPGIDSALYEGLIDLKVTNIRPYPIIIVANYDGTVGGAEEVFSFGLSQDRGSFEFVDKYNTSTTDSQGQTLRGGCYTWLINGKTRKSCYKKVN